MLEVVQVWPYRVARVFLIFYFEAERVHGSPEENRLNVTFNLI